MWVVKLETVIQRNIFHQQSHTGGQKGKQYIFHNCLILKKKKYKSSTVTFETTFGLENKVKFESFYKP